MKDDKALRRILQEKIAIINNKLSKPVRKDIEKVMFDKFNVQSARVLDIFNGFEPLESTPYHMLYKLTVSFKEVGESRGEFDYSDLNIENYFYENEIPEYSKPIPKKDEDIDVIFDDWHQTNIGVYSYIDIHTNIDYVMQLYNYNKLRFNPDVQRDLIVIETDGMPIYKLDINEKAINDMQKAMLDGSYFPVPGTIVINPELYDEYPIKTKNGKLYIDRKFKMDLAEGFHNYLAYIEAKRKEKDWQYPCDFRLYVMNNEDANRYILQMDKKNHFSEAQTTRIDTVNGVNYFIKNLNTSSKFNLRGTIDDNMRLYLFKLISRLYDIEKIPNAAKTLSPVISKLNYVIMETDHFNSSFTKEEWFIYLYLIKQSMDKELEFEELFNSIKGNELLEEIKFKNEPVSKHYKILNNLISEVKHNV